MQFLGKGATPEQPQIALCAANVPGQNHGRPINLALKSPDRLRYIRSRMTNSRNSNEEGKSYQR
jgi:hypothetical protein